MQNGVSRAAFARRRAAGCRWQIRFGTAAPSAADGSARGIDEAARCWAQDRQLCAAIRLWLRWRIPGGCVGGTRIARAVFSTPPRQCQTASALCRDAFRPARRLRPAISFSLHADANETDGFKLILVQ